MKNEKETFIIKDFPIDEFVRTFKEKNKEKNDSFAKALVFEQFESVPVEEFVNDVTMNDPMGDVITTFINNQDADSLRMAREILQQDHEKSLHFINPIAESRQR